MLNSTYCFTLRNCSTAPNHRKHALHRRQWNLILWQPILLFCRRQFVITFGNETETLVVAFGSSNCKQLKHSGTKKYCHNT